MENKLYDRAVLNLFTKKNSNFISTILYSLEFAWDSEIATHFTDGVVFRINPVWFCNLGNEERVSTMVHSAWHVALMQVCPERIGSKDLKRWNAASDYVVNGILVASGYTIPQGWLHDHAFDGMSTEEVYINLADSPDAVGHSDIVINHNSDINIDQAVTQIVLRAHCASQMAGDDAGTVPGEITLWIDKLINPILPWNVLLMKYMNEAKKVEYTHNKPNRRFMPEAYIPSLSGNGLDHIALLFDTSGSVTDEELIEYVSESNYVKTEFNPDKLTVIEFDRQIRNETVMLEHDSLATIVMEGRGGTAIEPPINWINKNKPSLAVIFTDGYFHKYEPVINTDVLWVIYNNPDFTSNIGKIIHYTSKQ